MTRRSDREGLRPCGPTKDYGSPRPEGKTVHFRQKRQHTHTHTHTHTQRGLKGHSRSERSSIHAPCVCWQEIKGMARNGERGGAMS